MRGVPVKHIEDCKAIQNVIIQLHGWADTWQIHFNEKKYTKQTVKLEETTGEKDLGVWINNDLPFKHYTTSASKKASSILGLIQTSSKHIDCSNMPQLYKTVVRLHLEYDYNVWWLAMKCQRSELEKYNTEQRNPSLNLNIYHMSRD